MVIITFLEIEMGIQELLNEYKENKHKIKEPYAKVLSEYFDNLKKENNKGRSKGDRKYSARNFKKPFISFLKKEGFEVYTEVNLFKPSKTISILPKKRRERQCLNLITKHQRIIRGFFN